MLDAPMPYLVGIRALEIIGQLGSQKESDFMHYLKGLDCLENKAIVHIGADNKMRVHNYNAPDRDPNESRFLLLGSGQRTDLLNRLQIMLQWFQSTLKKSKGTYEVCYQATENQQKICEQVLDFLQEQIFLPMLEPIEELGKMSSRVTEM